MQYRPPNTTLDSECVHRKEQLGTRSNTLSNLFYFIHGKFYEATDSPTERIAGSLEHEPLRLSC